MPEKTYTVISVPACQNLIAIPAGYDADRVTVVDVVDDCNIRTVEDVLSDLFHASAARWRALIVSMLEGTEAFGVVVDAVTDSRAAWHAARRSADLGEREECVKGLHAALSIAKTHGLEGDPERAALAMFGVDTGASS